MSYLDGLQKAIEIIKEKDLPEDVKQELLFDIDTEIDEEISRMEKEMLGE